MIHLLALFACGDKTTDTSSVEPSTEPSIEDTSDDNTDTNDTNDTTEEPFGADLLSVGDIVITEIMKNPCGITGTDIVDTPNGQIETFECSDPQIEDENGEWFEIYNTTGMEINLKGLMIHELDDGDSSTDEEMFALTTDVVLASGGYVVFAVSDDASLNGGVEVDMVYAQGAFSLSNGTDDITLSNVDGILDSVEYNDDAFPDTKGHSLNLNPMTTSVDGNDMGANWCIPVSTIPSGDYGTPGMQNDTCQ